VDSSENFSAFGEFVSDPCRLWPAIREPLMVVITLVPVPQLSYIDERLCLRPLHWCNTE